jgi:hypothetical protein
MAKFRFIRFGQKHFGTVITQINDEITRKVFLYFSKYHFERFDELRMFFDSESFTPCPITQTFSVFEMQVFVYILHGQNFLSLGLRVFKTFRSLRKR